MAMMVYSLLWIVQDLYHQPSYIQGSIKTKACFRVLGIRFLKP